MMLLAGVATSLPKIKKNDLIYCALYAAHCYRSGLISVAPLNREWDVNFDEMSLEECTNFLALMASWIWSALLSMMTFLISFLMLNMSYSFVTDMYGKLHGMNHEK